LSEGLLLQCRSQLLARTGPAGFAPEGPLTEVNAEVSAAGANRLLAAYDPSPT
jgi:hypothetical protein